MCDSLSSPAILKEGQARDRKVEGEAGTVQITGLTPGEWEKALVWEETIQLRKESTEQGPGEFACQLGRNAGVEASGTV